MDLSELRDIDSLHIEGTDTLVKGSLGWFIEAWAHKRAPLNSHWLVFKNCGTDLYNCWFVDSIYKERARSIIAKRQRLWRLS